MKGSFKKNEIICLICEKGGMKTLTRHIRFAHNLKPGEYRKQFNIPAKQSLAARTYSESRKKMAKERHKTSAGKESCACQNSKVQGCR
jgi:predicted transcriptional regulator